MLKENLRVALRALASNKLRSVLTILGIIIGVAAVIALVAMGNGVQLYIDKQFESQGANLVYVFPARIDLRSGGNRTGFVVASGGRSGTAASLTIGDVQALNDRTQVPDAIVITPIATGSARAFAGGHKYQATVDGTSPDYRSLNNWGTVYGDWFSDADYNGHSRVALIGSRVYNQLFPNGGDPTGEELRLNDTPFKIVGVLEQRAGGQAGSDDDIIFIPFTTARDRLFPSRNAKGQTLVTIIVAQA
ncbi:MAG TPA: ABC transporter permease, partial [Anaerolineae bacterium]